MMHCQDPTQIPFRSYRRHPGSDIQWDLWWLIRWWSMIQARFCALKRIRYRLRQARKAVAMIQMVVRSGWTAVGAVHHDPHA